MKFMDEKILRQMRVYLADAFENVNNINQLNMDNHLIREQARSAMDKLRAALNILSTLQDEIRKK